MDRNTRIFADLDLNFKPNPVTGDVFKKFDENAIKQSVKNLIMTNHYERPFHPEIGSGVTGLLFELATPFTEAVLRQSITNTIINFEPRVQLDDISIYFRPDNNLVEVEIYFRIKNTQRPLELSLTLERTR